MMMGERVRGRLLCRGTVHAGHAHSPTPVRGQASAERASERASVRTTDHGERKREESSVSPTGGSHSLSRRARKGRRLLEVG